MEKLSEIISKNIYSYQSGAKIGYVLNVLFDEKFERIKSLILVDEESEREALVDAKGLNLAGDSIFVPSERVLEYPEPLVSNRLIGMPVFSQKGEKLGKINEILLKNGKICAILTQFISFLPNQISLLGRDVIILGGKKKTFFEQNIPAKESFSTPPLDRLVSITPIAEQKENLPNKPYRISTDPNSLIGKMATKDIFGLNNELIIKKFEIISAKKINEAKKHNKLNLLFYNCK